VVQADGVADLVDDAAETTTHTLQHRQKELKYQFVGLFTPKSSAGTAWRTALHFDWFCMGGWV